MKKFYEIHQRIPAKRDLYGLYKTARHAFGTWNKAIRAAGFDPNPILFAKKFVAEDGHKCDSFTEKIIDDWLFNNGFKHERNYPYGIKRFTADFKMEPNILVEFFGLAGVQKNYDQIISEKRERSKVIGHRLIEIYPKDIYPNNRIASILKGIL